MVVQSGAFQGLANALKAPITQERVVTGDPNQQRLINAEIGAKNAQANAALMNAQAQKQMAGAQAAGQIINLALLPEQQRLEALKETNNTLKIMAEHDKVAGEGRQEVQNKVGRLLAFAKGTKDPEALAAISGQLQQLGMEFSTEDLKNPAKVLGALAGLQYSDKILQNKDLRESLLGDQTEKKESSDEGAQLNTLTENFSKALSLINSFSTGKTGELLKNIPATDAYNLNSYLDQFNASSAFSTLQDMRNASKTGGALGQVSEKELALLKAAKVVLKPGMGKDELRSQLINYMRTMYLITYVGINDDGSRRIQDRDVGFDKKTGKFYVRFFDNDDDPTNDRIIFTDQKEKLAATYE